MAYLYRDQSPLTIAGHTGRLLELYVNNIVDPGDYIKTDTLPYLRDTERGLITAVRRTALLPTQELVFFRGSTDDMQDEEVQAMEAFGYTLVIFAALPDVAKSDHFPNGFSRHGMFEPPTTQVEFLARIREMRREVAKLIPSQDRRIPPYEVFPFMRMYNFSK